MTHDDTGRASWPTHPDGSVRGRLAAGHATSSTASRRTPTPAETKHAEAIRAAIARGEPVTPAMRMTLGQYDLDHATGKETQQ
ncbi:hypothetical protein ACI798_20545 [Geodermatophilus sp. SYSU D01045]